VKLVAVQGSHSPKQEILDVDEVVNTVPKVPVSDESMAIQEEAHSGNQMHSTAL
jgi:hypothetical protein